MSILYESGSSKAESITAGLGASQQATISEAIGILESRLRSDTAFNSPADVRQFCQLHIAVEKDEHFCCLFLDSRDALPGVGWKGLWTRIIG